MSTEETVTFNLELNVEQAVSNIRRIEFLLYRSLSLARRLGLPEDLNQQLYVIQRLTMSIRLLHTAMVALEAASGPVGWALAGVGTVAAALSWSDLAYDATRGKW